MRVLRVTPDQILQALDRLPDYSLEDLARGTHLSYINARELLEDARFLLERSPSRALALAITAMEETAKIFILASFTGRAAIAPVPGSEIRKNLRSHTRKQIALAQYGQVFNQLRYATYIPPEYLLFVDRWKQGGLYVDLSVGGFSSPAGNAAANKKLAPLFIAIVGERLQSIDYIHRTEESALSFFKRSNIASDIIADAGKAVQAAGGPDTDAGRTAILEGVRRLLRSRGLDREPNSKDLAWFTSMLRAAERASPW